jgi:hypothetical protein
VFSFTDIEHADWTTMKKILGSCDAWSICRLGDYFVRLQDTKRLNEKKLDEKDECPRRESITNNNESMIINDNSSLNDVDVLENIYGSQPLFRLVPQRSDMSSESMPCIVEQGRTNDECHCCNVVCTIASRILDDESDDILRRHSTFFIDWFTDNHIDALLRVTTSKYVHGIKDLINDESVTTNSTIGILISNIVSVLFF